ncbi:MAG: hypothetical protein AAB432_01040 [Patescibacteria group bacterium]
MDGNDFKNQNWSPSQSSLGNGEGESPLTPSPKPNIELRTMASDLKSLEESGGTAPRSYVPPPSVPQTQKSAIPPVSMPTPMPMKRDVFEPPTISSASNETSLKPAPMKKSAGKKGVFAFLVTLVVLIGLGAVGYYVVYPMFMSNSTPNGEENSVVSELPLTSNPPPVVSEPPIVEPVSSKWLALATHLSYFKTAADQTRSLAMPTVSLASFTSAVSFTSSSTPFFEEVVLKNSAGNIISIQEFLQLITPSFFTDEFVNSFESDATHFVFINNEGSWPGLVLKLKDGVTVGPIQDSMSKIQSDPDNKNFFLTDPGVASNWQDGKVRTKPTSLVKFALPDAALSYTWFDNYLLLSTNLAGAAEAAKRLGF